MLRIKISPQANRDLEAIFDFSVYSWGYTQAEKYQDDIYDCFLQISNNPKIGELYFFTKGPYRKIGINRHIIFYKVETGFLQIVRVLHERMNLEMKF